jgi:hypothetical protein
MSYLKFILFAFIFLYLQTTFGQKSNVFNNDSIVRKNLLYIEFAGKGIGYSINYERLILARNKNQIYVQAGFTYNKTFSMDCIVPISFNYSFGKCNKIEIGICESNIINFNPYPETISERRKFRKNPRGYVDSLSKNNSYKRDPRMPLRVLWGPSLGYKLISKNGFLLKVTAYLAIGKNIYTNKLTYSPWGGLSIGYAFK